MNGFTDIHTHILPGVDDGAKDLREAMALVRAAWKDGTRAMILTPHYRGEYKKNTPTMLQDAFFGFCEAVKEQFPELTLYLGNEVFFETEAPESLAAGGILSLNGSDYVLLEFRFGTLRSQVVSGVWEMVRHGFTPIIAHAERYDVFRKDARLVDEVLEMGALIQLNADSVMGKQGLGVKRFCHKLLKAQQAHFIASDAHDVQHRPPLLRECFSRIHKKYGAEYARKLFCDNAQSIINNQVM